MTEPSTGPGFTEHNLFTAARILLCQGQTPSVVDVLQTMAPGYIPPLPQTYVNDLPFASAVNAIKAMAKEGQLQIEGEGSNLRIVGLMPVETDTYILVAYGRSQKGFALAWRPKSGFPLGDDVPVKAEDLCALEEQMRVPTAAGAPSSISTDDHEFMQELYGRLSFGPSHF